VSIQWIRDQYRVPAKRGGRVLFDWPAGNPRGGTIVGASGPHLRVRLDGDRHTSRLHPTWNVIYEKSPETA